MAGFVILLSKFIMNRMNSLEIEGMERFRALRERRDRGLLTFSNHVSLFDDPLLTSNFDLGRYDSIRWIAADAINFFGSPLKAWVFTAGKGVPIVRGSGLGQSGLQFLRERLTEGAWVHIFPEGGRTRDPQYLMSHPFKSGIGRLMAETRPICLPFYHYGMHEVLPVAAKFPRRGRTVLLVFGEPLDCDQRYIQELTAILGDGGPNDPRLWEALAARAYDALRDLEVRVHPHARSDEGITDPG